MTEATRRAVPARSSPARSSPTPSSAARSSTPRSSPSRSGPSRSSPARSNPGGSNPGRSSTSGRAAGSGPVPPGGLRRRGWWRSRWTLLGSATTVLLGLAVWLVGFTAVLGVRSVAVTGLHALAREEVLATAAVPQGEPLARVDTGAVADRIRAVPGVERVAVTRSWPSTLRIAITERHGVAVASVGGSLWLVDGQGVAFQRLPAAPRGLPRLVVASVAPADPATRAALSAVTALGRSVSAQLLTVSAPTPDSVTLGLRGGRTVVWGSADAAAAKAQVLAALLTRPGTVYDVSTPSVVTVR
jgi:cell division protein FtsQ